MTIALGFTVLDNVDATGVADIGAELLAAAKTGEVMLLPGAYRIASSITLPHALRFAKGAKIKPDSGVNVHLTRGYYAGDHDHVFDLSAGGTVTGDAMPTGYTTPIHFGADPATGKTDDRPAIEAATEFATLQAIRTEYATGIPVKFPQHPLGLYYKTLTRPIYVARTTHWYGEAAIYLRNYGGVEIRGAGGLDAVVFAFYPGSASAPAEYETTPAEGASPTPGIGKPFGAIRSRFSDLCFLPMPGATVRKGFVHNCIAFLERCVAADLSEVGFHAIAQTSGSMLNRFAHPGTSNAGNKSQTVPASTMAYNGSAPCWGNVNGSTYTSCYAQDCGLHGFVAHGNNAGTIKYYGCDAAGNFGAGFLDNTSIGCEYFGCHSAQNARKISHGGVFYNCIKYHVSSPATEPGVGADWRRYWIEVVATTAWGAWTPGTAYHPCGGINSVGGGVVSIFGHYTEGGIEGGVIARAKTTVQGGNAAERTPYHAELAGAVIGGGQNSRTPMGFRGERKPGDPSSYYGGAWGVGGGFTSGRIAQYGDALDDPANTTSALRLVWNAIRGRYEWQDASNSSRGVHGVSGAGFTGKGYSGLSQAFAWLNGMFLGDGSVTGNTVIRKRAATNLAAITDAAYGPAVWGDTWEYSQPVPGGKKGAVCTTAGIIGSTAVLKEWGDIDP